MSPNLEINDIFEELSDENKRLLNELLFANKCFEVLNAFKTFIDFISYKFKPDLNSIECQEYDKLNEDIEEILTQRTQQIKNENLSTNVIDLDDETTNPIEDNSNVRTNIGPTVEARNQLLKSKVSGKALSASEKSFEMSSAKDRNISKVKCDHCIQVFYSYDEYNRHLKTHLDSSVRPLRCLTQCGRTFANQMDAITHATQFHPGQTVTIYVNKKDLILESNKDQNTNNCENKNQTQNVLKDCLKISNLSNKTTEEEKESQIAPKRTQNLPSTTIKCPKMGCNQSFTDRFLRNHLMFAHKDSALECDLDGCDHKFETFIEFKTHLTTHSLYSDLFFDSNEVFRNTFAKTKKKTLRSKSYVCDVKACGRSFHSLKLYREHRSSHRSITKPLRPKNTTNVNPIVCPNPNCKRKIFRLKHHLMYAHRDSPFDCGVDDCNKKFQNFGDFFSHLLTHPSYENVKNKPKGKLKRLYVCKWRNCGKSFTNLANYKRHRQINHPERVVFKCQFTGCDYQSPDKSQVELHIKQHKDSDKELISQSSEQNDTKIRIICPKNCCNRKILITSLKKHLITVHGGLTFDCSIDGCSDSHKFETLDELKSHLLTHSSYFDSISDPSFKRCQIRRYKCNIEGCGQEFTGIKPYSTHRKNHGLQYTCDYIGCGYQCILKGRLTEHKKRHQDKPSICRICKNKYKSEVSLKEHMKIHFDSENTKYLCDTCGGKYKNLVTLRQHRNRVHRRTAKKVKCTNEQCDKAFKTNYEMKEHWRRAHSDNVIHCSWPGCEYTGNSESKVKLHMAVHDPKPRYVCDWPECGKALRYKGSLREHMRSHYNDKRYVCSWPGCTFRTVTNSSLAKHQYHHRPELRPSWYGKPKK